jgi:hypothetical protein
MYEEANAAFVAGAFLKIKCFLPYRNSKLLCKIKKFKLTSSSLWLVA